MFFRGNSGPTSEGAPGSEQQVIHLSVLHPYYLILRFYLLFVSAKEIATIVFFFLIKNYHKVYLNFLFLVTGSQFLTEAFFSYFFLFDRKKLLEFYKRVWCI